MADVAPANSGEQPVNTRPLRRLEEDQSAVLTRAVTRLNENVERLGAPSAFSAGNMIALLAILLTLAMAAFGAWGLSNRIDHLSDHLDKVEDKLGTKIDRLDDRFLKLDETISRSLDIGGPRSNVKQEKH